MSALPQPAHQNVRKQTVFDDSSTDEDEGNKFSLLFNTIFCTLPHLIQIYTTIIFMLISEEADADSSSEEDQEMLDLCNEQYARDDVDTETPQ